VSQPAIDATRHAPADPRSRRAALKVAATWLLLGVTLMLLSAALLPAALLLQAAFSRFGLPGAILASPFAYATWGVSYCLLFVLVKQCSMPHSVPGTHPFFSSVVARWALVIQLAKVAHEMFLKWVMGTDFIVWWYRLLGARIGERVTINTVFVYDWDLLEIGDDTFIGGRSTLMGHIGQMGQVTFRHTRIGARCTIGQDTTVFPGVVMGDGAVLGANSVALEGQRLEAHKVYLGVPARCVRHGRGDEAAPSTALLDQNAGSDHPEIAGAEPAGAGSADSRRAPSDSR
jgi:non-ribosomal peptide synthetase-like protein